MSMARARAMRCISPPDRYTPRAPTTASAPLGNFWRISSHCARWRARSTSSREAVGLAYATLSAMEALNSRVSWKTMLVCAASQA